MSTIDSNLQVSALRLTGTGVIGVYDVEAITSLRIVVEDAGASNIITLKGKIKGQENFTLISTITGPHNGVEYIHSYDILQVECDIFDAVASVIKVSISGFNFIIGAEINDGSVDTDSTWSSFKISSTIVGLGDTYVRSTRFETISSGTAGSITIPPEQTVVLDDFGGTIDAIVTTISGGRPTISPAQTVGGTIIAATFNAGGVYTLTGTPSSYPVALIYRVRQKLSTYIDTDADIIGFPQYDEVQSVNGKTGTVVITAADVGAITAADGLLVELQWDQMYPSFYSEPTYDINNKLLQYDIWDSSLKTVHVFTKVFTYSVNQVTQVDITHIPSGAVLTKTFTYNLAGYITNVIRVFTP